MYLGSLLSCTKQKRDRRDRRHSNRDKLLNVNCNVRTLLTTWTCTKNNMTVQISNLYIHVIQTQELKKMCTKKQKQHPRKLNRERSRNTSCYMRIRPSQISHEDPLFIDHQSILSWLPCSMRVRQRSLLGVLSSPSFYTRIRLLYVISSCMHITRETSE